MAGKDKSTQDLVERARTGDADAAQELLAKHRGRLRQMISLRMDPRLAPRIDASDVIQEALAEASRRMPDYLEHPPCAFYPWLRRIAWDRLVDLHRHHIDAQRRSVTRPAARARAAARSARRSDSACERRWSAWLPATARSLH